MSTPIASLPRIDVRLTQRGPGLHAGMTALERALSDTRVGHLRLDVQVGSVTLPVVMARSDLYVLGFESGDGWWRFSDAAWPFTPDAKSLGHGGGYAALGGLSGALTQGSILSIARLRDPAERAQWKPALVALLVAVAECARLIPVRMRVLGLLNGIVHTIDLGEMKRYIHNWSSASRGRDMSVPAGENLRVGFRDPTIIRH